MGRKKVLEKRLQRLQTKKNNLVERSQAADITVDELRSINAQVAELNEDIQDVQDEIAAIDEEMRAANPQGQAPGQGAEPQQRNANPTGIVHRVRQMLREADLFRLHHLTRISREANSHILLWNIVWRLKITYREAHRSLRM